MAQTLSTTTGLRWEMTGVAEPLCPTPFPLEEPDPGMALIQVAGCGVCHTDLGFLFDGVRTRSPLPLALGHEISGVVVAAGEDCQHLVGRPVIVPAVMPCGRCAACTAGHGSICSAQVMPGNDIPGGFASHVVVPAAPLCTVGEVDEVDDAGTAADGPVAASGCTLAELSVVADAVTTPFQAVHRARAGPGDLVIVVGLGGVGGFAAQIAAARGATVVGLDVATERLELMGHHGLRWARDPSGTEPRALRKEIAAFAADHDLPATRWKIFECSGQVAGQALAWGLLVHGAYLSIVGYTRERLEVRLSNLMAFDAKAVGNWGCLPELYPDALRLVLSGEVAVKPFVETFPMGEIQSVLEATRAHQIAARPVLVP